MHALQMMMMAVNDHVRIMSPKLQHLENRATKQNEIKAKSKEQRMPPVPPELAEISVNNYEKNSVVASPSNLISKLSEEYIQVFSN